MPDWPLRRQGTAATPWRRARGIAPPPPSLPPPRPSPPHFPERRKRERSKHDHQPSDDTVLLSLRGGGGCCALGRSRAATRAARSRTPSRRTGRTWPDANAARPGPAARPSGGWRTRVGRRASSPLSLRVVLAGAPPLSLRLLLAGGVPSDLARAPRAAFFSSSSPAVCPEHERAAGGRAAGRRLAPSPIARDGAPLPPIGRRGQPRQSRGTDPRRVARRRGENRTATARGGILRLSRRGRGGRHPPPPLSLSSAV